MTDSVVPEDSSGGPSRSVSEHPRGNSWMAFRYDPEDEWYRSEHPWGVCLDMNGWAPALRTAFESQERAEEFIRDEILGAPMEPGL